MVNKEIIISNTFSMIDSLKIMDQTGRRLLIICDKDIFLGVVSIGDIQRAILNKYDLTLPISEYSRKKITFARETDDLNNIKVRMLEEKIEAMPVINTAGKLVDVIEWSQLFKNEKKDSITINSIPVVIMAGGKGTRLLPLTNIIPKPLIPISDKTIIEEIMQKFKCVGCNKFYISVNYMEEAIKEYFSSKPQWDINFLEENKPLGTGGSLYLLKDKISSTFFVTNCDTLIDIPISDLVNYHRKNSNIVTVVSAVKTLNIPYGTIDTEMNGIVKRIQEKPNYIYQINSGFYVLEPEALDYIEDDEFLNITDLITKIIEDGKKVGAFPVPENSWIDMGNWNEYLKLVDKYNQSVK